MEKLPNTPQEAGKLHLVMLEPVKADLSGKLIDWGAVSNGREGYGLASYRPIRNDAQADAGHSV